MSPDRGCAPFASEVSIPWVLGLAARNRRVHASWCNVALFEGPRQLHLRFDAGLQRRDHRLLMKGRPIELRENLVALDLGRPAGPQALFGGVLKERRDEVPGRLGGAPWHLHSLVLRAQDVVEYLVQVGGTEGRAAANTLEGQNADAPPIAHVVVATAAVEAIPHADHLRCHVVGGAQQCRSLAEHELGQAEIAEFEVAL
mmetsp:Transcript_51095/g.146685  ORF Transcript_51095/g.146685 Transcript_51095/m.146685 type:complete len:200 (-) Transcript_51095:2509-3108(-)